MSTLRGLLNNIDFSQNVMPPRLTNHFLSSQWIFFSMDHPNTDSAWNSSAAHDN
jgi:hypothetical protein